MSYDLSEQLVSQTARPMARPVEALSDEALIDHILHRYHQAHREELPGLIQLARIVEDAHAADPAVPTGLGLLLKEVQLELESHMAKEEHVLFPLMLSGGHPMIGQPIAMMRADHDDHTDLLERLEQLCGGRALPEDACGTWKTLHAGVVKLIADLRQHIALENDILFPRFENWKDL